MWTCILTVFGWHDVTVWWVGVVVLRIDVTGPDSIQSTLIAVYDPRAPLPMSIVNFAIKRVAVSQHHYPPTHTLRDVLVLTGLSPLSVCLCLCRAPFWP